MFRPGDAIYNPNTGDRGIVLRAHRGTVDVRWTSPHGKSWTSEGMTVAVLRVPPPAPGPEDVLRVAAAIAEPGGRIRLADLRARFPGADLDPVLRALHRQGRIVLFPLDDPRDRTRRDEAAALALSGVPQHLVYLR